MIGIGTPTNQSKSPRPMLASMTLSIKLTTSYEPSCSNINAGLDVVRGVTRTTRYQCPVFGIDAQGSFDASASPFCSNSMECKSGERMNAI